MAQFPENSTAMAFVLANSNAAPAARKFFVSVVPFRLCWSLFFVLRPVSVPADGRSTPSWIPRVAVLTNLCSLNIELLQS